MKKSIIIVQTLLLIFSIYLYKIMLDERRMIKNNGTIKVFIIQVKDKGKYGIKYNVKYQDKIYYNIVGLNRNLKENSYDNKIFIMIMKIILSFSKRKIYQHLML